MAKNLKQTFEQESPLNQRGLMALELKKHVGAIHCANHMTLLQRKIANALLYHAYENLLKQEEHTIHIKTLCSLVGYESHDYKTIKESLLALISTVIEWNLIHKVEEKETLRSWNASSIIASASIQGPFCTYSYSKIMRELLYRPEYYASIHLKIQAAFKSAYGLALYENCIRYKNVGKTPWIELPTFRKLMGVPPHAYPEFKELKRRVIEISIKEVNQHAPICVSLQVKKNGLKISAVQFLVQLKEPVEALEISSKPSSHLAQKLMQDFGFSKSQVERVLLHYTPEFILSKMALIESSSSFKKGTIKNLARYLEKALQHDYQLPKSSQASSRNLAKQQEFFPSNLDEENEREVAYTKYLYHTITTRVEEMPLEKKHPFLEKFENYLKNTSQTLLPFYRKQGIQHNLIKQALHAFIRSQDEYHDLLADLSFDEYQKTSFQEKE